MGIFGKQKEDERDKELAELKARLEKVSAEKAALESIKTPKLVAYKVDPIVGRDFDAEVARIAYECKAKKGFVAGLLFQEALNHSHKVQKRISKK